MYTPHSELAPTLDWMLQSAQVSDVALAETLVRDYAAPLMRLASSLLPDQDQALKAVSQTITRGVLDRRRYPGTGSALAWLYALALRECGRRGRAAQPRAADLQRLALGFRLPIPEADPHVSVMVSALDAPQALVLYLAVGNGLSASDLAQLLRLPLERAEALLDGIGRGLDQHRQHCRDCALRPGGLAEMEGRLRSAWQSAGPALNASQLQRLPVGILARVAGQRQRQRTLSHAPELLVVGGLMAAMFALGWLSNRLWLRPAASATAPVSGAVTVTPAPFFQYSVRPGDTLDSIARKAGTSVSLILFLNLLPPQAVLYPGQLITLPAGQPRASQVTAPPFTPVPAPPPLDWRSTLHDIQQRAFSSPDYWHSLWANVEVIQYGLPGYVGPPQDVTRKQVWLLKPSYSRVIYGPADGDPIGTYVVFQGRVYGQDLNSQRVYQDLTSDLVIDLDLQTLFVPGELSLTNGRFRVAGQEPVAGREAMMLDWQNINGGRVYRYWIDAQTGVILRRREYGGANFSAVLDDITVTDIAYDVATPPTVFDPQAYPGNRFAVDYTGAAVTAAVQPSPSQGPSPVPTALAGHEALPLQPPPPNFDPASSRLTLQWQPPAQTGTSAAVDVFADRYYLGKLSVDSASILACRRSPDGRLIAFSHVLSLPDRKSSLDWVNLASLANVHTALPGGSVSGGFAFAPDSRRLAFFGCEGSGGCGLYTIDTTAGQLTRLLALSFADYLLWRPDGQELGLLASMNQQQNWRYLVVNARTGAVTYQGDFDWLSLEPGPESPTNQWKVPSQIQFGGLEACIEPPGTP